MPSYLLDIIVTIIVFFIGVAAGRRSVHDQVKHSMELPAKPLPEIDDDQVAYHLRNGQRMDAMRRVRKLHRLNARDASILVDHYARRLGVGP